MEKAKKIFMPILFIGLIVLGIVICYYTGSLVADPTNLPWGFKLLTVFAGGLLWVLFGFIVIIAVAAYENFKTFFN